MLLDHPEQRFELDPCPFAVQVEELLDLQVLGALRADLTGELLHGVEGGHLVADHPLDLAEVALDAGKVLREFGVVFDVLAVVFDAVADLLEDRGGVLLFAIHRFTTVIPTITSPSSKDQFLTPALVQVLRLARRQLLPQVRYSSRLVWQRRCQQTLF